MCGGPWYGPVRGSRLRGNRDLGSSLLVGAFARDICHIEIPLRLVKKINKRSIPPGSLLGRAGVSPHLFCTAHLWNALHRSQFLVWMKAIQATRSSRASLINRLDSL